VRGYTAHSMHKFENKRVAKWASRKCLKRKGDCFFLDTGASLAEGEAHFSTAIIYQSLDLLVNRNLRRRIVPLQ
jgi:hypothetical protein